MKATKITYRTNNPQPGYKTEYAEVEVELGEFDSTNEAFEFAKRVVNSALGLDISEEEVNDAKRTLARARRAGLAVD